MYWKSSSGYTPTGSFQSSIVLLWLWKDSGGGTCDGSSVLNLKTPKHVCAWLYSPHQRKLTMILIQIVKVNIVSMTFWINSPRETSALNCRGLWTTACMGSVLHVNWVGENCLHMGCIQFSDFHLIYKWNQKIKKVHSFFLIPSPSLHASYKWCSLIKFCINP